MTTPTWEDLRERLLTEPSGTLHASIQWEDGEAPPLFFMNGHYTWGPGPRNLGRKGESSDEPVQIEVWRHGRRLRVERNGVPVHITDGTRTWDFWEDAHRPVLISRETASWSGAMAYRGEAQWLINGLPAIGWTEDDVRPDAAIEGDSIAGRSAWAFTLRGVRVVVDQESLHTMSLHTGGSTFGERFVDPEIGLPVDEELFSWSGPIQTERSRQKAWSKTRAQRLEEAKHRHRDWLLANVVESEDDLVNLPVTVDLTPTRVPVRREEAGEFRASAENMSLIRVLPDSELRHEEDTNAHRWSAQGFNWELLPQDSGIELGRQGISEVWEQLHPGVPASNYRAPGE
ncbi:hypothetical protein ACT3SZ_11805 [Corynebacterium sp. AOP40-9SA-29]|uniref:hypothetical protein n=1 Tax=Corynebacterium sp. AOP40-9SA-29 TaxID=3457677 RepID=UPI0040335EA3